MIPAPPGKVRVTIRLGREVLEWFRKRVDDAGGGNYQTEINRALREHMAREPWAAEMRRILREELQGTRRRRPAAARPRAMA